MKNDNSSGDATEILLLVIAAALAFYFSKYLVFAVWILFKIAEFWIWSRFQPAYTAHLQAFVDTVTIRALHWNQAEFVNGQVLSIAGHGWFKPVALAQTALAVLLAFLIGRRVLAHSMRPVPDIPTLVRLQKQQFPWGYFWLKKPRTRDTMRRPGEIFHGDFEKDYLPVLKKQLGRKNASFASLDAAHQNLYAAFVLQIQGKIDPAQAVLRGLAREENPGAGDTPLKLARNDWDQRMKRFHYERACFIDALFTARSQNLLPSAWFNWLKIQDRPLWMALNSTPPWREVIKPFRAAAEAVAPLAWWINVLYRDFSTDDDLEIALGSVNFEEALHEINYQ